MPENKTALENVVNWLVAGYPEVEGYSLARHDLLGILDVIEDVDRRCACHAII